MILPVVNRALHWMVIGVISPVLTFMIIAKGLSLESVGYVMALLSSFVVIFEIPSGILSDRVGRKTVYLISLAVFFVSFLVIFLGSGFLAMATGFSLFGLARSLSSGSIESDFIDQYAARHGKDRLHRLVTGMSVGETLGLAVGAVVGGVLPAVWDKLFPADNRYNGNVAAQMAIVGALALLTVFTHAGTTPTKRESIDAFLKDTISLVRSNGIIGSLFAGTALWGFSLCAVELYWQPRLGDILGSESQSWLFGALNGGYYLMAALGSVAVGSLIAAINIAAKKNAARKVGEFAWIGILKILIGAAVALLASRSGFVGFSAFFLAIMGLNGMVGVLESTALNREIPDEKRSSILSLSSFAAQLGGIVASVAFSLLIARVAIPTIWILAGSVFALSSILYFGVEAKGKGRA